MKKLLMVTFVALFLNSTVYNIYANQECTQLVRSRNDCRDHFGNTRRDRTREIFYVNIGRSIFRMSGDQPLYFVSSRTYDLIAHNKKGRPYLEVVNYCLEKSSDLIRDDS